MICENPLKTAVELINNGVNIFITGGGGVGKSYILQQLKNYYKDDLDITSTTGISAFNIGGQTIHSWAGIGTLQKPVNYVIKKIKNRPALYKQIKDCKILAIDEISMMSDSFIKYLDEVLQRIRECEDTFGGLQVIFTGDFFQLPPVKNKNNPLIDFCFNSTTWTNLNLTTLYLKEVKRQSDKRYIEALNNIRVGKITDEDKKLFEDRTYNDDYIFDKNILQIYGKNKPADEYNKKCFNDLKEEPQEYYCEDTLYKYKNNECEAISINNDSSDKFSTEDEECIREFNKDCKASKILTLKKGCRIMLLKNLDIPKGLVNGACGTVSHISATCVKILFDNKIEYNLNPEKFEFEYMRDDRIRIVRLQYPLTLAYAITTHKSQGMTFDKLVVNFNDLFGYGMGYVALSRTKSLKGLYIKGFNTEKIATNPKVIKFYNDLENDSRCIIFDGKQSEESINVLKNNNKKEEIKTVESNISSQEKIIKDDDRIAKLEAELSELKIKIEKLTKSKSNETEIKEEDNCNEEYIENTNENTGYFADAFEKFIQQDYDGAIELFQKCVKLNPNNASAYSYIGHSWKRKGNYKKAISNYNKALKLDFDNPAYFNNLAKAYYKNKEYSKAVENWNKVLELDSKYEIDYFEKAHSELNLEQLDEAIDDFTTYLNNNPDDALGYNCLGLCKYFSGDYEAAINDYNKAIELKPDDFMYLYDRANAYYQNKEYKKALQDWKRVLEINPEYEIDYFEKAYSEYELGQYHQAIDDYTTYLENNPNDYRTYNNRGLCKYNLEDYEDALNDYNKAIELEPDNPKYLNNRADAYYSNDEYEKALQDWKRVLEINPEYEIDYFEKAYSEYELEQYYQAIDDYTTYLENNPNDDGAYNNRGLCKYNLEDYEDAIKDYSKAIELEPDYPKYLNNRANAYYFIDEYEKALQDWEKVLEINPEYEIDYYNKAYSEDEVGLNEQAYVSIEKYLSDNPDIEMALKLKEYIKEKLISEYRKNAKSYLENKQYQDAYGECKKILDLDTNDKYAYLYLGAYYYYNENTEEAQRQYEKAIEIDNNFDKAYANIGIIMEDQKQYELAAEYYSKAIECNPSREDIKLALKNIRSNSSINDNNMDDE